uniref:Uncharacterized protein n=1 Tax=Parascaris univalens TaxID=6257 RepID=A0A915APY8_PARUN
MYCRYIWMIISEPFSQQKNPNNQIGLKSFNVYGYPLRAARNGRELFTNSGIIAQDKISSSTSRSSSLASDRRCRSDEQFLAMNSANGGGSMRNLNSASDCGEHDSVKTLHRIIPLNPSSSVADSDGFVSIGDRIGEEPLSCVRIVRKILANKYQKALKVGRDVEAGMCLRAVQRIDEADAKIVRLKSLMRDQLCVGEIEKV